MLRAGLRAKKMPESALLSLSNIKEFGRNVVASSVNSITSVVWPSAKIAHKNDQLSTHVKILKLMPALRKSNHEYEAFKKVIRAGEMLQVIFNEELSDEEAHELTQDT